MPSKKIVRRPPGSTVFENGVEDREQLPAAGHYGLQSADLLIGKGLRSGPYDLAEARQDRSVDPIGLGEGPRSPGEVTHLTGIDNHHRQSPAAKAPTTVRSKPPVASTITSTVGSSRRREIRASIPLSS